jgi:hypothetical protein
MLAPMAMYATTMGFTGLKLTFPGPYLSMGNLGFSKTICDSTYIGIN